MISFNVHAGWRTVCGGILLHFVIGTMYNWGNIITYVTSYLRAYDPSILYKDTVKIYPVALAVHGVTLLFSGWVSKRVGYRNCCLLGSFIFVSATFLPSSKRSLMLESLRIEVEFAGYELQLHGRIFSIHIT